MEPNYVKRVLIALGGNAILQYGQRGTVEEMRGNIEQACRQLAPIAASWYQVIITHGNGPQVGNILIQNEVARGQVPALPLDVCGAQSQGQLGYLLQQSLRNELRRLGKETEVATVITQTVVDSADPAFKQPSKPIGPWLTSPAPQDLTCLQDPEKGWRRLVPSPKPKRFDNIRTVRALLRSGIVVIACGGGGVPVTELNGGRLQGQEAVIDKDLASQCLASAVGAHIMLILTDVPEVYLRFGQPAQRAIGKITASEIKKLLQQGEFQAGSIGPKVAAAVQFVEQRGEKAVIANIDLAQDALKGKCGTTVHP